MKRTYALTESIQRSDKRRIIIKAKRKQGSRRKTMTYYQTRLKNQSKKKRKDLREANQSKETSSKGSLSGNEG